jgi:hypothetical protein
MFLFAISIAPAAFAAIAWDAGAGTQWWFNPTNWNTNSNSNIVLPPTTNTQTDPMMPPTWGATDTQINIGTTGAWNVTGEGVVYDPENDPGFDDADTFPYAEGFGPQVIQQLYLSRQTTSNENLLTIKGDLTLTANMQLGRSSNTAGLVTNGRVVQLSGTVKVNNDAMDIAATDTSGNVTGLNYGNGTYEYHGGILEVSQDGGSGLRLSPSSSTVGAAGIGRFQMHNPGPGNYVRAYDYNAASGAGVAIARLANGDTTGVGISTFYFENGGTMPIQVNRNLILNNGLTTTGSGTGGIRSPRLELVLNEAPMINESGVPQDLGLFDVNFGNTGGTSTTGAGEDGDFFDSLNGSTLLTQGAQVSAMYLGSTYTWTISYTGNITWSNADMGIVGSISDTGDVDVVLKGLSSIIVPAINPGDHNHDGVVDLADYVTWRKTDAGNMQGYTDWVENFGETGPGAGANAELGNSAVPEPASVMLVFIAGCAVLCRRRRVRQAT